MFLLHHLLLLHYLLLMLVLFALSIAQSAMAERQRGDKPSDLHVVPPADWIRLGILYTTPGEHLRFGNLLHPIGSKKSLLFFTSHVFTFISLKKEILVSLKKRFGYSLFILQEHILFTCLYIFSILYISSNIYSSFFRNISKIVLFVTMLKVMFFSAFLEYVFILYEVHVSNNVVRNLNFLFCERLCTP